VLGIVVLGTGLGTRWSSGTSLNSLRLRGSPVFSSWESPVYCYVRCRCRRHNLVSRSCLDYSVGLDRQRRLPWERALLLALSVYSHFPVSSHFRHTHAPLVVTLPAYSRAPRTHTSGVLTRRSSFSRYPSRLVWSRRGPLTRLACACCSRCIRHTRRGLVAVLSHALRGLVVLAVSVTPGVVSSRSSHTPCVGSLFVWGLVVAAPVSRIERGRSVERDNRLRGEESPD